MAAHDDLVNATTRLEAALERIARSSARAKAGANAGTAENEPDRAVLAARLDSLIDQLRSALSLTGN